MAHVRFEEDLEEVSKFTAEELAEVIARELGTARYSTYIIDECLTGQAFLALDEAAIDSFVELESGAKIKLGHSALLKKLKEGCQQNVGQLSVVASSTKEKSSDDGGSGKPVEKASGKSDENHAQPVATTTNCQQHDPHERKKNVAIAESEFTDEIVHPEHLFSHMVHSGPYESRIGKPAVRTLRRWYKDLKERIETALENLADDRLKVMNFKTRKEDIL